MTKSKGMKWAVSPASASAVWLVCAMESACIWMPLCLLRVVLPLKLGGDEVADFSGELI